MLSNLSEKYGDKSSTMLGKIGRPRRTNRSIAAQCYRNGLDHLNNVVPSKRSGDFPPIPQAISADRRSHRNYEERTDKRPKRSYLETAQRDRDEEDKENEAEHEACEIEEVNPVSGQDETTKDSGNHEDMLERLQKMEMKNEERLQQHTTENRSMKERIGIIEKIQRKTLSTLEGQEAVIETIRVDISSMVQSLENLVGEIKELKGERPRGIVSSVEEITPQWEAEEDEEL